MYDLAAQRKGASEDLVRRREVTRLERLANRRRAPTKTVTEDRRGVHHEMKTRAQLFEQLDVALAVVSEVEVLTHHDVTSRELLHEHPLNEGRRTLARELLVKAQDTDLFDAEALEALEALVERANEQRCAFAREHGRGVRIESDDGRVGLVATSYLAESGDDLLVTDVKTVKDADRHGTRVARRRVTVTQDKHRRQPSVTRERRRS